jgi:hypothetical protein
MHMLSASKMKDKMCMLATGESLAMSESVGMRKIQPLSESGDGVGPARWLAPDPKNKPSSRHNIGQITQSSSLPNTLDQPIFTFSRPWNSPL